MSRTPPETSEKKKHRYSSGALRASFNSGLLELLLALVFGPKQLQRVPRIQFSETENWIERNIRRRFVHGKLDVDSSDGCSQAPRLLGVISDENSNRSFCFSFSFQEFLSLKDLYIRVFRVNLSWQMFSSFESRDRCSQTRYSFFFKEFSFYYFVGRFIYSRVLCESLVIDVYQIVLLFILLYSVWIERRRLC